MPDDDLELRLGSKSEGPFRSPAAVRSAGAILRAAVERRPVVRADGAKLGVEISPGLDDAAVNALERAIGTKLPPEIDELVRYASGFTTTTDSKPDIDGDARLDARFDFGLEDILPRFAPIADDNGNSLGVYIRETGEWGPILHCSYDPPVVCVEAPDVATWLLETLFPRPTDEPVSNDMDVYCRDENGLLGMPVEDLRASEDHALRRVAEAQPAGARIYDLRHGRRGDGFRISDDRLVASGTELVFVRLPPTPRPSFAARVRQIFGRK